MQLEHHRVQCCGTSASGRCRSFAEGGRARTRRHNTQGGLPAATPLAARRDVVRWKRPPRCDGCRAPASVAHISARLPRCAAAVAFDVVGRGRGALLLPRMPTISTTLFSKLRSSSRDSRDRKARRNSSSQGPDQSRSCLEQDSGSVRFAGSRKPAKFCRVPVDASVEDDLVPLLIKSWGLSPPAAIISVPAVRGCTRDDVFHHDQRGSHHIDPNPSRTPNSHPQPYPNPNPNPDPHQRSSSLLAAWRRPRARRARG